MIHPLFKTLVTQPELLAEHAGAYAELAAVEAADLGARLRRRAVLMGVLGAAAVVAAGMAGMALMLFAAIPADAMPAPVLLALSPGVPLAIALWCAWSLHRSDGQTPFAGLREQWTADRALWRTVTEQAR